VDARSLAARWQILRTHTTVANLAALGSGKPFVDGSALT